MNCGRFKDLESAKWYLWHGNVFQAFSELQGLEMDVEGATFETKDETARKLLKGLEELWSDAAAPIYRGVGVSRDRCGTRN